MRDADRTIRDTASGATAASVVISTALFATAQGLSMDEIEAVTGLGRRQLTEPDARHRDEVVALIWRALIARHPDRALPLEMAQAAPFTFFGTLWHGARFAADLREVLATLVRFRRMLSDRLDAELYEEPPALRFGHPCDAIDGGAAGEVGLALGVRYFREVLELHDVLDRVDLAHRPFGPIAAYEAFFGVPLQFDAPYTALRFRPGVLDAPLPVSDQALFAYIQQHLDHAHRQLGGSDALAEVRAAIAHNAARGEYGLPALARKLGMSARVLQRHVADHGTTPRALIDEARVASARALLSDRRMSIEEVSFLLGYSNERAFRRAFQRLTGETPAQHRRALGR